MFAGSSALITKSILQLFFKKNSKSSSLSEPKAEHLRGKDRDQLYIDENDDDELEGSGAKSEVSCQSSENFREIS